MSTNNSIRNFGLFSRKQEKPVTAPVSRNVSVANEMAVEHADFVKFQNDYNAFASATLLGDVVEPITGLKFSELFAVEDGDMGQKVVVFNPKGTNGSSWSKNCSGMVGALLTAFGTRRYITLEHGLHERIFDRSLVIEHNVRSEFMPDVNKWMRFDWNNRRFTADTPYFKSQEAAGWMSKHVEIDRMLLALLGNQTIRYNFFDRSDIAWARFEANILNNLNVKVELVNVQLANQAEAATTLRKITRDAERAGETVKPGAIIVDSIDLRERADQVVTIVVKTNYAKNAVERRVKLDANGLSLIANTLASSTTEYVHLK